MSLNPQNQGKAQAASSGSSSECVKVMIRVRPMNAKETAKSNVVLNSKIAKVLYQLIVKLGKLH